MFWTNRQTARSHEPQKRTGLERLDLANLHFADEMPAGRRLHLPGRGTIFVREAAGPVGAPTVLLVHGLLGTADLNWSLAIPELSSRFRVIAPDLRGHGGGSAIRLLTRAAQVAPEPLRRAAMMAVLAPRSTDGKQGRWVMNQIAKHDT